MQQPELYKWHMNIHIKKAIEIMGTQSALAKAIGVKQQHIHKWLYQVRKIPAEYVLPIERAVNGKISRYKMRPDIYPLEG